MTEFSNRNEAYIKTKLETEWSRLFNKRNTIQPPTLGNNIKTLCEQRNIAFSSFCDQYILSDDDLKTPIDSKISFSLHAKIARIAEALGTKMNDLIKTEIKKPAPVLRAVTRQDFTNSGQLILEK